LLKKSPAFNGNQIFITVFTEPRTVFRSTVMLLQPSYYILLGYILNYHSGIVISIVARLRAGKPWNCDSNSGKFKKFICSANHSAGLGGPLGLLLNRCQKPWNCDSNSGKCKKFICSANHSAGLGGPLGLLLNRCQRRQCGHVINLSTHLYVVSKLRMTGVTTPIPLCASGKHKEKL